MLRAGLVVALLALAVWLDVGLLWGATSLVGALLTLASAGASVPYADEAHAALATLDALASRRPEGG